MKKTISVVLIGILMISSMCTLSFAEAELNGVTSPYGLYVGGVAVTSDNADCITGAGISGSVSYDIETSTLTLNNATISGEHKYSK